MRWLWYFILYSFGGFVLEVLFARVTGQAKKDRKCLLLLPLCPVYGVGALLILQLAPLGGPLWVLVSGAAAATAAEFLMGAVYRFVLRVEFWDYSAMPGNLAGLVCPQFALCWGVLALVLVYWVQPAVGELVSAIPAWMGPPAAILLGADGAVSAAALRETGSAEVLRWYR